MKTEKYMNPFDITLRAKMRKWWQFGGLVIDRDEFEWLKDQAVEAVRLRGENDRMKRELENLGGYVGTAAEEREKRGEEIAKLKDKYQLAINVLEDNGLYGVYQQRVADLRARKRTFAERRLDV